MVVLSCHSSEDDYPKQCERFLREMAVLFFIIMHAGPLLWFENCWTVAWFQKMMIAVGLLSLCMFKIG